MAILAMDARPYRLGYTVELDGEGRTRSVTVHGDAAGDPVDVALEGDGSGRWLLHGRAALEAPGCVDVDLGFSPVTNSLPIWRLGLEVGQRREITVAWLRFPSLSLEEGRQEYARLDTSVYRYRSGGFEAELQVDDEGLVERYGAYWLALARA